MITEKDKNDILKALCRIEAFMRSIERNREAMYTGQRHVLQKARAILAGMGKKEEKLFERIQGVMEGHVTVLQDILSVNRNVDETLCNVLMAIRQNEYLQAYYPSQNGLEDQHVVGKYVGKVKNIKSVLDQRTKKRKK